MEFHNIVKLHENRFENGMSLGGGKLFDLLPLFYQATVSILKWRNRYLNTQTVRC